MGKPRARVGDLPAAAPVSWSELICRDQLADSAFALFLCSSTLQQLDALAVDPGG